MFSNAISYSKQNLLICVFFKQRENNIRGLTMLGHFGFECLPHQLVNRAIQKGFSFNILCVGKCQTSLNYYLIFPNAHFNLSTAVKTGTVNLKTYLHVYIGFHLLSHIT